MAVDREFSKMKNRRSTVNVSEPIGLIFFNSIAAVIAAAGTILLIWTTRGPYNARTLHQ